MNLSSGVVDEGACLVEPAPKKMGARSAVLASLDAGKWAFLDSDGVRKRSPIGRVTTLGWLLRYASKHGMCGSKKVKRIMDIDQLVKDWIEAIVGMCLAHDKDTYDAHDARADKLLGPILTAPIAQVREFYTKLLDAMNKEERVPWLVKMGFEAWGDVMVKDAPDEGVKRLKNKLAKEIAELVEEPIRDQIPKAVQRALRWRDPETLEKVKEQLKAGAKPTIRGRESCLFLEMGRGKKKVSVML